MLSRVMKILVLVFSISVCSGVAQADEILEAINEATEAYNEQAYTEAAESLEYAKQLILQMSSEGLMKFLPAPKEGWEGKEAKSQNLGMMGGSSAIEKEYTKPATGSGGRGRVKITIMGESPMFAGMMTMFNPAIAGSDGGKLQKIKRNKAIVKYNADKSSGEIMINVAKKYIVMVKGRNVEKKDMMYFAESIDFKGLKTFQ